MGGWGGGGVGVKTPESLHHPTPLQSSLNNKANYGDAARNKQYLDGEPVLLMVLFQELLGDVVVVHLAGKLPHTNTSSVTNVSRALSVTRLEISQPPKTPRFFTFISFFNYYLFFIEVGYKCPVKIGLKMYAFCLLTANRGNF